MRAIVSSHAPAAPLRPVPFSPHRARLRPAPILWSLIAVLASPARGLAAEGAGAQTDTVATLRTLGEEGFENLAVGKAPRPRWASGPADSVPAVAFENRRYRHSVEALARVERAVGVGAVAFERRLALTSAAIVNVGTAETPVFRVRYPSDPDFPHSPRGAARPTWRTVDLLVGPLTAYELGRPFQPVQYLVEIEPRLQYNPWPGARAQASLVIPVHNDFEFSAIHPDRDVVRPGLLSLEQFAWVPRVALVSGTFGLLGDNRYGLSVGAARPLFEGRVLIDAQADLTGDIDFLEGATLTYMTQWSSFLGVTYRPPFWDIALHGRVAQFIDGEQGEHVEFRRSMGDVDVSFFAARSAGLEAKGVRFTLPIPPLERSTRSRIRVLPVDRFPIGYRTEAEAVGLMLTGVASREDFLRQLSHPGLNVQAERYLRVLGKKTRAPDPPAIDHVALNGMTGFIKTPWAGTIQDGHIELSASHIPARAANESPGKYSEEPWSVTLGILPRTEIGLRFTRIPGLRGGVTDPNSKITTDTDHMASARLTLLTAREGRPGLAIGVDDVEGTRRFHSAYAVAGMPFAILHVQNRLSLGYAFDVFTAARHVLDGGFGAFEVSPWRVVAVRVEFDSDKLNAGIGVGLKYGLRLRVAALNLETLSVGAGWTHEL